MNELKSFISKINEKCKISLAVYDKNGNLVLCDKNFSADKTVKEVKGIKRENDKTFFEFNFLGEKYIGAINGIGDANDGLVYLITELSQRFISEISPSSKEEFYRDLIDGKISYLGAIKHADKFRIKESKCAVLIIEQEKGDSEDVVTVASNYVENDNDSTFRYDGKRTVLIKFLSDNNKEYRSIIEYAEFLSQTIYEETGFLVRIAIGGTVKRFTDLEKSFLQALSVFSMEKTVSHNSSVRSFREFVIVKALDELPLAKRIFLGR